MVDATLFSPIHRYRFLNWKTEGRCHRSSEGMFYFTESLPALPDLFLFPRFFAFLSSAYSAALPAIPPIFSFNRKFLILSGSILFALAANNAPAHRLLVLGFSLLVHAIITWSNFLSLRTVFFPKTSEIKSIRLCLPSPFFFQFVCSSYT